MIVVKQENKYTDPKQINASVVINVKPFNN